MMKQLSEDQLKDIVSDYFSEDWAQDKALLLLDHFTNLVKEYPVADESPMAKMADALREKARQEQQAYQDRRNQATEWGPMPEGTEADRPIPIAPVAHVAGDETSRYLEWAKDRSAWEMPVGTPVYYAALASAPVAGEAFKDECAATGQTCSYGPHGYSGERQCKYCGAKPDATPQASEAGS